MRYDFPPSDADTSSPYRMLSAVVMKFETYLLVRRRQTFQQTERVRLENHDGLARTYGVGDSANPALVRCRRRRAACRITVAVANGDVVDDEHGERARLIDRRD